MLGALLCRVFCFAALCRSATRTELDLVRQRLTALQEQGLGDRVELLQLKVQQMQVRNGGGGGGGNTITPCPCTNNTNTIIYYRNIPRLNA